MPNTWIALIPAYQPTSLILELLYEVRKNGFQAVVVNDGSSKNTAALFQKAEQYAMVLTHPENRGKGCALKTGLAYIQKHYVSDYVVVTMDADGQHQISDAVKVCRAAEQHPDRLILGSRGLKEDVPIRSRFGNSVTRFAYRLSTGLKVHDTQTGLRAFSSCLVREFVEIPGERYEYEMNVLLECPRKGIPIKEIEIETIYLYNNASSHFHTLKDSYRIYKEIFKFSASSFVSFLVDYALYSLLLLATATLGSTVSLAVSNILARVVSASINYTLNRKLVFQSKNSVVKSILQYFLLSAAILVGNTLVLGFLADTMGINRYAAKLCTEILFFVVSWLIQKCFIFRGREEK